MHVWHHTKMCNGTLLSPESLVTIYRYPPKALHLQQQGSTFRTNTEQCKTNVFLWRDHFYTQFVAVNASFPTVWQALSQANFKHPSVKQWHYVGYIYFVNFNFPCELNQETMFFCETLFVWRLARRSIIISDVCIVFSRELTRFVVTIGGIYIVNVAEWILIFLQ